MGLSGRLAALSLQRVHVLPVEVPGWWTTRVALEAQVRARGWTLAESPADADALVICGDVGTALRDPVQLVWDQLPSPRARAAVTDPTGVDAGLDAVAAGLCDVRAQKSSAASRVPQLPDGSEGDMDHGDMDHGDMDHGDMDHGDMDHGDMDMAPSGIPLASGAPDRDGLEMDVLQVPLGPVLVHWPAGLLLRCTLAGDVVTSAEAQLLRGGDLGPRTEQPSGTERAARSLDAASSVLALTGWSDPAGTAQRLRDRLVVDPPAEPASLIPDVEALRRQVTRSRMLRWTLRRTGPASGALATGSDVYARLLALLDDATAHLRGDLPSPDLDPASALEGLCDAVTGLELAAVRLVVASLDLRTDRLPAEAVLHG